jgi:hypothetical protein
VDGLRGSCSGWNFGQRFQGQGLVVKKVAGAGFKGQVEATSMPRVRRHRAISAALAEA